MSKASHPAPPLLPAGGSLASTGRVHLGNYHKAAKLLPAPTISVCCLPQESLHRAKTRGWKLGMVTQEREQQLVESVSDRGGRRKCKSFPKKSLTGLFVVSSG